MDFTDKHSSTVNRTAKCGGTVPRYPFLTILNVPSWLVLSLVAIYASLLFLRYKRLSLIPGPLLANFSGVKWSWSLFKGRVHIYFKECCDKYGPLVRIGPNDVITTDIDFLMRMSGARSTYGKSSSFYPTTRFEPGKDHMFSQLDEKKHVQRRAQSAAGYSGKENLLLENTIDKHILNLVELIRRKYVSTPQEFKPMDLAYKAQYLAADVITDLSCGEAFGDLTADDDVHGYIEASEQAMPLHTYLFALGLTSLLTNEWIQKLVMPTEKDPTGMGKLIGISKNLVAKRFGPNAVSRPDMLESLRKRGLSQEELVTESIFQIVAGVDTTSTALRGAMLLVMTNATVYRKLQAEIDDAVASNRVSRPVLQEAEFKLLPYLQAVVTESIRVFPPTLSLMTKVVPPQGDTVAIGDKSFFLPGGTNVSVCIQGLQHSKAIFGPDAEVFRPERWLDASGEKLALMQKAVDFSFGYGRYQCMGKGIALAEVNKTVFELFRRFDVSLVNSVRPWDAWATRDFWLIKDFWVRITEREGVEK